LALNVPVRAVTIKTNAKGQGEKMDKRMKRKKGGAVEITTLKSLGPLR
jgi:hypothetical protein